MGLFSRDLQSVVINGYQQVQDTATSTVPISIPNTGVFTLITNNGLGVRSTTEFLPVGVTNLWDATTNSFDFSELEVGDTVDIRVDLTATVGTISSTINVDLNLGIGGFAYSLPVVNTLYYLTAGVKRIVDTVTIGIDDDNTRLNPAQIVCASTDALSVVNNGFLIRVHRRRM